MPPPATTGSTTVVVVVEQLARARHERPECLHIVVAPRLMTGRWRRRLIWGTDGYGRLLANDVWPLAAHFEPLLIFFCLPFHSWNPRHSEWTILMERICRTLQRADMSAAFGRHRQNLLRQLLVEARGLAPWCEAAWYPECFVPQSFKPFLVEATSRRPGRWRTGWNRVAPLDFW
jgi:hypothetical protein